MTRGRGGNGAEVSVNLLSSPVNRSQVEDTNDTVTPAFCLFFLNISVEKLSLSTTKAPFQEET